MPEDTTRYQLPGPVRHLTRALSGALEVPEPDVVRLAVEELCARVDDPGVVDAWYVYGRQMRRDHDIHPSEQDDQGRQGLEKVLAAAGLPPRA